MDSQGKVSVTSAPEEIRHATVNIEYQIRAVIPRNSQSRIFRKRSLFLVITFPGKAFLQYFQEIPVSREQKLTYFLGIPRHFPGNHAHFCFSYPRNLQIPFAAFSKKFLAGILTALIYCRGKDKVRMCNLRNARKYRNESLFHIFVKSC